MAALRCFATAALPTVGALCAAWIVAILRGYDLELVGGRPVLRRIPTEPARRPRPVPDHLEVTTVVIGGWPR